MPLESHPKTEFGASLCLNPDRLLSYDTRRDLHALRAPNDPYLALFQALAGAAREKGDAARLNLIQRAFYFKTGVALSAPSPLTPTWQITALRGLIKQWGWDSTRLRATDQSEGRSLQGLQRDYHALVAELTDRFQSILQFCRRQGIKPQGTRRVDVVARQLFARFEPKPGKVEKINTGLADVVRERQIRIQRSLAAAGPYLPIRWAVM